MSVCNDSEQVICSSECVCVGVGVGVERERERGSKVPYHEVEEASMLH
jgi:hypothetical protein